MIVGSHAGSSHGPTWSPAGSLQSARFLLLLHHLLDTSPCSSPTTFVPVLYITSTPPRSSSLHVIMISCLVIIIIEPCPRSSPHTPPVPTNLSNASFCAPSSLTTRSSASNQSSTAKPARSGRSSSPSNAGCSSERETIYRAYERTGSRRSVRPDMPCQSDRGGSISQPCRTANYTLNPSPDSPDTPRRSWPVGDSPVSLVPGWPAWQAFPEPFRKYSSPAGSAVVDPPSNVGQYRR